MESEISFMKNDKCAIETPKGFTVLEIIDAHIAEKGTLFRATYTHLDIQHYGMKQKMKYMMSS